MKIGIEFEQDFETGNPILIHLGRIQIGDHIGRLFFTPEGKTKLIVDEQALKDKSIMFTKTLDDFTLSGFHCGLISKDE